MSRVATDDAARRQEFIWLGPVNSPWPFEARGRAWIMAMVLCPSLTVIAFVLSPRPLLAQVIAGPLAVVACGFGAALIGVTLGIVITRRIGKVVTPTRPLRHHRLLLTREITAPRPPMGPTTAHLVVADDLWIEDQPHHRQVRAIAGPRWTTELEQRRQETN